MLITHLNKQEFKYSYFNDKLKISNKQKAELKTNLNNILLERY